MKCYLMLGEYGPVASQHLERLVYAQNEQNARILFESYVKRHFEYLWERMGQRNVHVITHKPRNFK